MVSISFALMKPVELQTNDEGGSMKRVFRPFYCYIEKSSGQKVVTIDTPIQRDEVSFYYVAACPNEEIARRVYDRHLAIARA